MQATVVHCLIKPRLAAPQVPDFMLKFLPSMSAPPQRPSEPPRRGPGRPRLQQAANPPPPDAVYPAPEIRRDVPPPPEQFHKRRWPFKQMAVGDSIFVPNMRTHSFGSRMAWASQQTGGGKFTARKEGDGIRVWRIA